ncbi:hypothetical protein [Legionella sp. km772]|uniref:hypothetical protein n=1 Tax=Legionella sp. km772 TaxID=2498111 RepID=UPI000F8D652D|nr:hypothetical protein [Legionella sp. km772]RUR08443.1 hypothetical protein ELY15_10865 [Legionella sp. km772]
MKRIVISLLFFFLAVNGNSAQLNSSFPDEISIREHWISLTKSYDIETKTHKLGTLYRRFFSLLLTYDFYDPNNVNTLSAKARFFSFGAHLDLYDPNGAIVGSVEEKIFTFFPTFEVYARDLSTKLARAEMNFWGTKFYIYDPATNKEMAIMSRPFFRFKNDWTIHVTDQRLLEQKNIDPRVLMTVLAVQGEIEDWQKEHRDDNNFKTAATYNTQLASEAPKALRALAQTNNALTTQPQQEELEALTNELDQDFNATNTNSGEQSNEERIQAFTAYCENLIQTPGLPVEKKNAIASLLKLRLQGRN